MGIGTSFSGLGLVVSHVTEEMAQSRDQAVKNLTPMNELKRIKFNCGLGRMEAVSRMKVEKSIVSSVGQVLRN